jgi:hypothetical protein
MPYPCPCPAPALPCALPCPTPAPALPLPCPAPALRFVSRSHMSLVVSGLVRSCAVCCAVLVVVVVVGGGWLVVVSAFGKNCTLLHFTDSRLSVRKSDGALQFAAVNPAPAYVHRYCAQGQWTKAVRLCRWGATSSSASSSSSASASASSAVSSASSAASALASASSSAAGGGAAVGVGVGVGSGKDEVMWSTLAVLSIHSQQLDTAEIALAALDEVDKVQFVQYMKGVPCVEARSAELLLYRRRPDDAEALLLQSKLLWRAIQLNVRTFRWHRYV